MEELEIVPIAKFDEGERMPWPDAQKLVEENGCRLATCLEVLRTFTDSDWNT